MRHETSKEESATKIERSIGRIRQAGGMAEWTERAGQGQKSAGRTNEGKAFKKVTASAACGAQFPGRTVQFHARIGIRPGKSEPMMSFTF
jgi:hypothetical protein